MARVKTDVTKNIRKTIVGTSSMDYSGEVGQNLELSKTLHGVSSYIETLSTNQQDLFKKLIAAVQEIPKNNAELQQQQKNIFDNLIKTTALLKKAAENEKDPEKKKELEAAAASMMDRGESIQKNTDDSPRGIREMIGAKRYGIKPQEIREKGLVRSVFSQAKRDIFGGSNEPKFQTMVEKQQDALSLPETLTPEPQKNKDKNLKEKTRDNLRGVKQLEDIMKSLLTEVSVIRKVVEGRMKFDPKTKGYKDPDTGKTVSKKGVREVGAGLYTKKEEASSSKQPAGAQISTPQQEGSLDAAETQFLKKQGFDDAMIAKIAAAKAPTTSAPASTAPANASVEANPNTLRDVSKIDQNPFDEARFTSSGIDKDTEKMPTVEGRVEVANGGGGFGGMVPDLGSKIKNFFRKTPKGPRGNARVKIPKGPGGNARVKIPTGVVDDVVTAGSRSSKLFKGASRLLGRAATPLTIAAGAYEGYTGYQDAKQLEESGKITKKEATKMKGEAIGGATVGTGGALAGAAIGATVGSVVPVVGTAIGGIVGGLIGWYGGKAAGSAAGGAIASSISNTPPSLSNQSIAPAAAIATIQAKTRAAGMSALNNQPQMNAGQSTMPPVVNNVVTNNAAPATSGGKDTSYAPPVRTNDNSFLRYQDRRMTRIL